MLQTKAKLMLFLNVTAKLTQF